MSNISFGFENPLKSRFNDAYFKALPKEPGVYTFIDDQGVPLYIGKADNLKRRLMSYQAAKPGQSPDHILEMIEHAVDLRLEILATGEEALRRESELIRSIRPRYNIALNYDVSYLFIGFKPFGNKLEFRLSHMDIHEGFTSFGCFRHRGKVKAGYSAMLRLCFAAFCTRERFNLPAKICRSSPAYSFTLEAPPEVAEHLENFLAGKNSDLLRYLLDTLLAKPHLPKQLYLPLQRDFEIAKEFFQFGPEDTRKFARKLRSRDGKIEQEDFDAHVSAQFLEQLREKVVRNARTDRKTRRPRTAGRSSAS